MGKVVHLKNVTNQIQNTKNYNRKYHARRRHSEVENSRIEAPQHDQFFNEISNALSNTVSLMGVKYRARGICLGDSAEMIVPALIQLAILYWDIHAEDYQFSPELEDFMHIVQLNAKRFDIRGHM